MFRIITTDGSDLGITETVNYIKIHSNGCFVPTTKEDAIGVAFHSVPYNLLGHEVIADTKTVVVSEVDGGNHILTHQNSIDGLLKAVLEG